MALKKDQPNDPRTELEREKSEQNIDKKNQHVKFDRFSVS